jgi:hypothetical protein
MKVAYAARLVEENFGAIASEKPGFDIIEARDFLATHGGVGFFIRDEEMKAYDCRFMSEKTFYEIYDFEVTVFNENTIFHRLVRK